jgi:hypothetical protein
VLIGLALLVSVPASDAKEKRNLVENAGSSCSGPTVGKVIQKPGTTTVKVKITNGTPGTTRDVYEVCQSGSVCHDGCGFDSLGTITTDGSGKAKKKFTRVRPDPVHYDICESGCYYSGVFTSPGIAGGAAEVEAAREAVEGGDPARQ